MLEKKKAQGKAAPLPLGPDEEKKVGGGKKKGKDVSPDAAGTEEEKKHSSEDMQVDAPGGEEGPVQVGKKKRKLKNVQAGLQASNEYSTYIFRTLKGIHPNFGISKQAMSTLNSLVADMFIQNMEESRKLALYNGRNTVTSREVMTSIKLIFPGELSKHAVAEANKALSNYAHQNQ